MSNGYTARDITVLEGLEPVRKRPGMYIGGTDVRGYHHLLWEVVDNAVDEAMNGFASTITVVLEEDGRSVSVADNGRGIPVDVHPQHGKTALELIFTTLHAGGKFDQKSYRTAGGLHGVGSSVVNALSESLRAQVKRDEVTWEQSFRRGRPTGPLKEVGPARGTGTTVSFRPDSKIFGPDACFDAARIEQHLETRAYLHRGLRIVFKDRVSGQNHEWKHEQGLAEYLDALVAQMGEERVHDEPFLFARLDDDPRIEVALCWTGAGQEKILSFVNGIRTRDGGTHEQGLKDALGKGLRAYFDALNKLPRGLTVGADEMREGLVALISVFVAEPQFQGQTKDRLNNTELRGTVDGVLRAALEGWLHSHPSVGEAVTARVVESARARAAARAAVTKVRSKVSVTRRLQLPGKLADCSAADVMRRELFLVEGESAGGSAKQGRQRETQAVLPLRGKVLNVEQASLKKVLANKELADLVNTLGCGIGKDCDPGKLRYGKVVLLMDADSDGHHISTLLLTFFYRHMPALIEAGRLYIAQPPLYRIDVGERTHWARDEVEKERILAQYKGRKVDMTRFKGLGEMMPKVLYDTTLSPTQRRLLRVTIPEAARDETKDVIEQLMGKDPAPRLRLIQEGAGEVEGLDL